MASSPSLFIELTLPPLRPGLAGRRDGAELSGPGDPRPYSQEVPLRQPSRLPGRLPRWRIRRLAGPALASRRAAPVIAPVIARGIAHAVTGAIVRGIAHAVTGAIVRGIAHAVTGAIVRGIAGLPGAHASGRAARGAVIGILLAALLAPAPGSPAWAATVPDLYEAVQPVGTSHDAAFVEALKTVVVRVSGQRDAPARLGTALNSPRQYVQRFGQTADGLLQVRFDDVSIDRLLTQAGLPIWGHERPEILVLLDIEADEGVRNRIAGVARERGLPLKWPVMDAQIQMANEPSLLRQAAARYGANAALRGRVQGGTVRWTLLSADGEIDTSGGWDEGVHLAADTFARVFAVSGSALDSVTVEVSGIVGLDAYASTLNYLEGMTLVRSVALEQVMGDTMRFRLTVRGGASTLRRAIALDDKLVPQGAPASAPAASLAFRYRP